MTGAKRIWRARIAIATALIVALATTTPVFAQPEGVGRHGGADRYHTALLGSQSQWPDNSTNTVVLANAFSFADALSASALCGELRAPLLLTSWGAVRDDVIDEISRVTPFDTDTGRVYLIGGTDVIGPAVEQQLADAGFDVARLGGDDRYHTSALIAKSVRDAQDGTWEGNVWLARGDAFPDGLAVSPYAYQIARPVLLTRTDALPTVIAQFMDDHVQWAGIVGGTEAVSANIVAQRDAMGISGPRIYGVDRYETSAELADYALTAGGIPASADYIGIATGMNFPDALAGGIVTGQADGVILLTETGSAPQSVLDFAADNDNPDEAWVFGGFLAVSEFARLQFEDVLYP